MLAKPWVRACVICHRVRDYDGGDWSERPDVTDATHTISHGYCESCFVERYGPLEEEEDQNVDSIWTR